MMKEWEVWSEGYRATGEAAPAQFLGRYYADTFRGAVERAMDEKGWDRSHYNAKRLTFWGCHFYDNEADARKVFG